MTTKAQQYGVSDAEALAAWEAIDRALHLALVVQPVHVLDWLAEATETTSILQDKAYGVLDFLNPAHRARNDGTSHVEAVANIRRDIEAARGRV